jgi:hypothetical protein
MGKRQFRTITDCSQSNLDPRLAGIVAAHHPTPGQDDASWWVDYQKLTAALVLCVIQLAEAQAILPTDARIGFRQKNGARIRAPPIRYAVGRCDSVEYDFQRRFDVPYKSKAGHYFLL